MNAADRERARGLASAARATQRALERFTRKDELPREMYHVLDMPFSVDPFVRPKFSGAGPHLSLNEVSHSCSNEGKPLPQSIRAPRNPI